MATTTTPATTGNKLALSEKHNLQQIKQVLNNERYQQQLAAALKHARIPADRMVSVAMTVINSDWKLRRADPMSMAGAILKCAIVGLVPDGNSGHAYLVPFKNGKKTEAAGHDVYDVQALVGYRGYVHKAYQSDAVARIFAQNIFANDHFELDLASGLSPVHKFDLKLPRGEYLASYAVLKLKNGEHLVEVMMKEDIDKIRERSKSKSDGPWVTDYLEMARKTPLRRIAKWCPDPELQRLAVTDEEAELGNQTIQLTEEGDIIFVSGERALEEQAQANTGVPNLSTATNGDLKSRIAQAKDKQPTTIQGTEAAKTDAPKADAPKPDAVVAPEIATQDGVEWIRGTVTRVFPPKAAGKGVKMSVAMGKDVMLSTFHESHFPHLKDATGKICEFQFEQKGEYRNIEHIQCVGETEFDTDGTPIIQQREVVKDAAPATEDAALMSGSFFDEKK